MTHDQYNRASTILKQIETAKSLQQRLMKDYCTYKLDKEGNKHLLDTLSKCEEVVSVLIEIDENKFKEL